MTTPAGVPRRSRWVPWTVLAVASMLLAGSVAFAASSGTPGPQPVDQRPVAPSDPQVPWSGVRPTGSGSATGGMMGDRRGGMMGDRRGGMMGGPAGGATQGGPVWLVGDGTSVATIAQARARAAEAAAPRQLHPGEVMQFSLNFYVELKDSAGASVAEVLVDPAGGSVVTEFGPAMMWNAVNTTRPIGVQRAAAIAGEWLAANRPAESVGSTDSFPGHYTMDTVSGGNTVGMLSVNAATGAAWYHTWHGTFIAKEDA